MAATKNRGSSRVEAAKRRRSRLATLAREDILRAAAVAFATRGYQAATLQQIATAAGFTAASLYTYFPSKEAIFRELEETVLAEITTPLKRKLPAGLSFADRVRFLIEAECEVAQRRRDAVMCFMRLTDHGESVPHKVRHHGKDLLTLCEQWMRRYAPPQTLTVTAEEAGLLLWSTLNAFVYRWVTVERAEPLARIVGRIQDVFLHGVVKDPRGSS